MPTPPPPPPITWATIELALCAWVATATGRQCIMANQNAPQPQKPYSTILLSNRDNPAGLAGAGMDEVRTSASAPGIVQYVKWRQFSASINTFSNTMTGVNQAVPLLETAIEALALQSVQTALRAARVASLPVTQPIVDLSVLLETRGESRAQCDVRFNVVSSLTEDVNYFTSINSDHITIAPLGAI